MTDPVSSLLLHFFCAAAALGAVLMLFLRHPMRVALALAGVMLSLAGVYAMLAVHVVAIFQVLIYVGAVMVFMVYVIMLLDLRDPSFLTRYSRLLVPGLGATLLLLGIFAGLLGLGERELPPLPTPASFTLAGFSQTLLRDYWLHFELTSVLLLTAVVAVMAVLKGEGRGHD